MIYYRGAANHRFAETVSASENVQRLQFIVYNK